MKHVTLIKITKPISNNMKVLIPIIFSLPLLLLGQKSAPAPSSDPDAAKAQVEEGIAVTSQLVVDKCSGCHTKDQKGNLARISWERSTPEGWEEAIKRMVRLRGVSLTPEEARNIVKYLSTNHGLAPEEAVSVSYYAEKRIIDEVNIPDDKVRGACASCHAFARPLSWRRSAGDWKLLANLHVALYPQADEAFRFGLHAGEEGPEGTPSNDKTLPVDAAMTFLAKAAPLETPEWAAWRARMRAPKLAGRWLVSADVPGKGKYFGEMVVEPGANSNDEFTTRVILKNAVDGSTITREGRSLVYTGYAWRGHSKGTTPASKPDDLSSDMREVMSVSPDQSSAQGRWFWGQYQEFGMDVKLQRAGSEPTLLGIDRLSLKTGSKDNRIRITGDNLPPQIATSDLDFGSGVTVDNIVSHTASEAVVDVSVTKDAVFGKRDVAFRRSVLPKAVAIYDRIDYIRVLPDSALAHLGSKQHPKGLQQFEAIAYQRGEDGKSHTADDVELGPVDVTWSVEEFIAAYGDDDKNYVGTLSPTGLFTPSIDGPNPKRQFSRNNYGDVWIVATAKNDKGKDGRPLIGKSYLVVTVPVYMQWDQPEVGQ